MLNSNRPYIVARLCNRGGKLYLENQYLRVEIENQFASDITELYCLADGTKTTTEILKKLPNLAVSDFLNYLESIGMAYDVLAISMYGHESANYPDPSRYTLSEAQILNLQVLPLDPSVPMQPISQPLDYLDSKRATCRRFTSEGLSKNAFEQIVLASYAKNLHNTRVVPSAGAMLPLQHYYAVMNVDSLVPGVYKLASQKNAYYLTSLDIEQMRAEAFITDEWQGCSLIHIIGFDIQRSSAKYGSRAYRFALVEAGHSAQNSIRKATELDIGSWEFGGYNDSKMKQLLRMKSSYAGIATVVLYGNKDDRVLS